MNLAELMENPDLFGAKDLAYVHSLEELLELRKSAPSPEFKERCLKAIKLKLLMEIAEALLD